MPPFSAVLKDRIILFQFNIVYLFLKVREQRDKIHFHTLFILHVCDKKGDVFTATETNDLAQCS